MYDVTNIWIFYDRAYDLYKFYVTILINIVIK